MKHLSPQPLKDQYWVDIEAQLKTIFYEIAFAPLMDILRKATPQAKQLQELHNASGGLTALLVAIRSGRVQYVDGRFTGDFSVALSRDLRSIGAVYDGRSRCWNLPAGNVPEVVRAEAARYQTAAHEAHAEMKRRLDEIQENLDRSIERQKIEAERTVQQIEKGWQKAARVLEVQPKLSAEATEALAEDYNQNLKLHIKDFSRQSIEALRGIVEDNAQEGYRFDKLIEAIRHRYGVTANKARFLARQETGLFMAKYRKQRFEQAGVRRYRWSTAHDERVRDSHKHLDGRVFSYDAPPITDRKTGARNNPGEDFNCRCLDIPLLETDPAYA